MEEQGTGSRQILEAISSIPLPPSCKASPPAWPPESKEALRQSASLKSITGKVASSMDEMAESADQIANTVIRVKKISHKNLQNIDTLSRETGKFKVD